MSGRAINRVNFETNAPNYRAGLAFSDFKSWLKLLSEEPTVCGNRGDSNLNRLDTGHT